MNITGKVIVLFVSILALSGCAAMLEPPSDIQRSVDYLRQDVKKLSEGQEAMSKKIDLLMERSESRQNLPSGARDEKIAEFSVDDSSNLSQGPNELYNRAMNLMKSAGKEEAEKAFADFIVKFPQSDLSDNAQYWIGECFYSQKNFQPAKEAFRGVIEHFPFGNKVPDALYKEALCAGELGEAEERTSLLKQILENYPYSEAAEKAESLLENIEK